MGGLAVSGADHVWHEALGSLEQLLLNVALLVIVGALAMAGQRLLWRRVTRLSRRDG
jgi:hypothetical protein